MTKTKSKTVTEFAKTYQPFIIACKRAGIDASKNEASKFRRGFGVAITFSNEQWRANSYKRLVTCSKCSGTGKGGKNKRFGVCNNCKGKGKVSI